MLGNDCVLWDEGTDVLLLDGLLQWDVQTRLLLDYRKIVVLSVHEYSVLDCMRVNQLVSVLWGSRCQVMAQSYLS